MNLYDRRGYLNIPDILKCKQPFIFVVGGRGTGKTFGALREARRRYRATGARFMLLRRMQSQVDLITKQIYGRVLRRAAGRTRNTTGDRGLHRLYLRTVHHF